MLEFQNMHGSCDSERVQDVYKYNCMHAYSKIYAVSTSSLQLCALKFSGTFLQENKTPCGLLCDNFVIVKIPCLETRLVVELFIEFIRRNKRRHMTLDIVAKCFLKTWCGFLYAFSLDMTMENLRNLPVT